MFLIHNMLLVKSSSDRFTTFLFSSRCCFVTSLRPPLVLQLGLAVPHRINQTGVGVERGTADMEVIRQDKSVVFTPLLCNNKDRIQRGTKGNNSLYTAQSFGLCIRAASKETHLYRRCEGSKVHL